MRMIAALALTMLLTAPAWGQNNTPESGKNPERSFGSVTCPQRLPCDSLGQDFMDTPASLYEDANQCIKRYFSMAKEDGLFDEDLGLDDNNCLVPRATETDSTSNGMGDHIVPQCCIIQIQNNTCALRCNIMEAR